MTSTAVVIFHIKTQSELRARVLGTNVVTCLLVAISLVQSGWAQVVDAAVDKIHRAKQIVVINVRHGIEDGVGRDPIADVCRPFRMSSRQVEHFLRIARSISVEEFDHAWDWAPCYVSGRMEADHTLFEWQISASGVAKVWSLPNESDVLLLACDEECNRLVLQNDKPTPTDKGGAPKAPTR